MRERIINLVYKVVTGKKRTRTIFTPLLGGAFLFIVLFLIFFSFYMDRFFGFPEFVSKSLGIGISLPFLISGPSIWIWCAGKFLKMKGTPVPVNPPPKLITDGPYAYSRNPMMTGLFILLAGIGILFRSVSLVFIITPIFILISVLEFKYFEEPELEMRFGEEYSQYKKKTPLIIPDIWKSV